MSNRKQASSKIAARSSIPLSAVAIHQDTTFMLDVSRFTSEEAKERHLGECGDPPEVEILARGEENGVLAARGTIRVQYNARRIFESLCDPEETKPIENKRIFDNCASVNFRQLIHEDQVKKTRLFEVSKTGQWNLLGIPINFESTVLAMEESLFAEFSLQAEEAGGHEAHVRLLAHRSRQPGRLGSPRSGCTGRAFQPPPTLVKQDESIVLFYNEAVPFIRIPSIFKVFAGRLIQEMAVSLLEDANERPRSLAVFFASCRWMNSDQDLRSASKRWQKEEAEGIRHHFNAIEPGSTEAAEEHLPQAIES
eukprot:g33239.t1